VVDALLSLSSSSDVPTALAHETTTANWCCWVRIECAISIVVDLGVRQGPAISEVQANESLWNILNGSHFLVAVLLEVTSGRVENLWRSAILEIIVFHAASLYSTVWRLFAHDCSLQVLNGHDLLHLFMNHSYVLYTSSHPLNLVDFANKQGCFCYPCCKLKCWCRINQLSSIFWAWGSTSICKDSYFVFCLSLLNQTKCLSGLCCCYQSQIFQPLLLHYPKFTSTHRALSSCNWKPWFQLLTVLDPESFFH
jgi:hypothetical protein